MELDYSEMCDYESLKKGVRDIIENAEKSAADKLIELAELVDADLPEI